MTEQIDTPSEPSLRRSSGRGRMSVAPVLSLVGLLIAGLLTAQVYRNWTPTLSTAQETPTITPAPVASGETPTPVPPLPTDVVVTNPEIAVPGTLVYARSGNLWVQSGTQARQITESVNGSQASQPAFSPDGQWIYYIDTRITSGRWYDPNNLGAINSYTLYYPVLCHIHPDGTGKKDILSGLMGKGGLRTFIWLREPSISPDGATAAIMSDGPNVPGVQDVMIHLVNLNNGKLGAALPLIEVSPLGLSDPEYARDGKNIAYTMEGRSGKFGAPSIWIYTVRTGAVRRLAAGYRGASWSPDGKYVAATKVSGNSLNVVVLDVASGRQVAQVTSDGASWAPVWSPDGTKLVYMHLTGAIVDLNMVYITGTDANPTFKIESNLTDYSGLDGQSTAAWFIPGFGPAPAPTAAPSQTNTPGPTAAPSPSAAPSPTDTAGPAAPTPSATLP